jgi:flagellin-like protein
MRRRRYLRRPKDRRGIANLVAVVMLVALTVVAGVVLWSYRLNLPTQGYYVTYQAMAGLKVPVWGDPTDCTPVGYPQAPASTWSGNEWNAFFNYCENQVGNFSLMNATSITITSVTPTNIPLNQIWFYFLCHNTTPVPETTTLVGGSLAAMTWFPGSTTGPAPGAPTLGWCGSFDANGFGGGAFGTLYNRMGIFTPIRQGVSVLEPGDTFILYVHTPGSVYDPQDNGPDTDDYHGAPAWCFSTPGACEIKLVYAGATQQLLADIQIYSISGAGQ